MPLTRPAPLRTFVSAVFVRRTQTRAATNGAHYFTYRLVQSERTGTRVRQRTLLNLGRHFPIPQADWPTLCSRLDQILSPQHALLATATAPAVEQEAQRIAAQLLARQVALPPAAAAPPRSASDLHTVEVSSLELLRPRSVGVEQVGLWAMEQVELIPLLQRLGFTGPQRAAAVGSIIGRMAAPGSERATYRWLGHRSGLGELLEVDFETLSMMQLYRASDALVGHQKRIEEHLFNQVTELFGLETTVTLYDLTNTYFEGEAAGQPLATHGHSKEKRSDCPLLTLALVLDGSGFVRRCEVMAGSIVEGKVLKEVLERLEVPTGALIVMDCGAASEENLKWLREQGYRYLAVSLERTRQFEREAALSLTTAGGQQIQVQKVASEDGAEVRLYCYSQARKEKEQAMLKKACARFEKHLKELHEGLSRPRTHKKMEKIWARIGRLKAHSSGAGQHYHIEVTADESGQQATAVSWELRPVAGSKLTHPGVYCLRSNQTDWDAETMWRSYIMLTDLEAVFRSLKSELGLRPIFHQKQRRSNGHLFITVLAYQLVQVIRRRLREHGEHSSWHTLRSIFAGQQRVTATFRRADGRTLHVRKATVAEPEQRGLYDALGVDPAPGGVKKMVVA